MCQPDDKCTKTGRPVLSILQEKHHKARIPAEEDFDVYQSKPDLIGISVFGEDVVKQAASMSGAAVTSRVNRIQGK